MQNKQNVIFCNRDRNGDELFFNDVRSVSHYFLANAKLSKLFFEKSFKISKS